MKITFYQIAKLFPDNSAYLGELIELETLEVNVDLSNISRINLLLDNNYQEYNYIKVARTENDYYYYFLETWTYYNHQKLRFQYKIDIIRTLQEKGLLNHEVNVLRYSNILDMTDAQKAYFWKNQETKLSSAQIKKYDIARIKYSDNEEVQNVWGNMKWLYIWLQPKKTQSIELDGEPYVYQYSFTKQIKEHIIETTSDQLPLDLVAYKEARKQPTQGWYSYPLGQAYYCTDTQKYYRFVQEPVPWGNPWQDVLFPIYKRYFKQIKDFEKTQYTYYFQNIPAVQMTNMPNSLYCMVLPLTEVLVRREWVAKEDLSLNWKELSWNADNIIPYLFDVDGDNVWNNYIVDIKLSLIPPFDVDDPSYECRVDTGTGLPLLTIPHTTPGNDFRPIKTLHSATIASSEGKVVEDNVFFPFLRIKPTNIMEVESTFEFPEINKDNIVFNKYYLSIVEERRELDIPQLKADNATKLFYYEDLHPGRTNIAFGFAPEYENQKETIFYLLHSPSTIFFDRDTSLPIFTDNYQNYLANNKNFIQQAQLQRNSQLVQNLIGSGSQAIGAAGLSYVVPGYSSVLSVTTAAGKAANAIIQHGVAKKQFDWQLDNIKSAPGNYKSATATVSFMLSLDIYDLWIETYTSNEFDIALYNELINDVGFNYYNYQYSLQSIIDNVYTGSSAKKYLQATITGFTNDPKPNLPLINILAQQLQEGVNIYL